MRTNKHHDYEVSKYRKEFVDYMNVIGKLK